MQSLKVVSHYVSTLSKDHYWPGVVAVIAKKCHDVRRHLETACSEDSKWFIVSILDLSTIEKASSPTFLLKQEYEKQDVNISWDKIMEDSKINLVWRPVKNINSLTDWKRLLEVDRFKKNDAYTFSIVFVSIKMFLLNMAKDHLQASTKTTK
jgi:hypothetical protein